MKHPSTIQQLKIIAAVIGVPILLALAACGGNGDGDGGGGGGSTQPRGFAIETPEIDIAANQEVTYCYYFRTPNADTFAVTKWRSAMTPGVFRVTMFTTTFIATGGPADKSSPGTVSAANCGFGAGGQIVSTWTYAAHAPGDEMALPADDGTGTPVAMEIPANAAGFLQIHFFNATDQPLKGRVTLEVEALGAGVAYTKTASYVTYNANINIPPQTNGDIETFTCAVPNGAQFWRLSTHAHKQAVRTAVKDGTTTAFQSTDWLQPGAATWPASSFFTFTTNKLTYECEYNNPTNRTITSGDSQATDEMCMAVGYFFPATKPVFCINSTIVPF